MKLLFIFFLMIQSVFSLPFEDISWGMNKSEVEMNYKPLEKTSFNENEEVFITAKYINSDTVLYQFLFYKGQLIQITVSSKNPRRNSSFSKLIFEKLGENYTFSNIKNNYIKTDGHIKQIKEYSGFSKNKETHLLLKVDQYNNSPQNIFIFTDPDFINE